METIKEHLKEIARNDSHTAFRAVYNAYYQRLMAQAMYYFGEPDAAQEVVADVFVALWQARKILDRIENPDAYLFIALKHARAKYIERNYKTHTELLTDQLPETVSDRTSDHSMLDSESQAKYRTALEKLPPRCAEVFRLVREEKKKYAEAAEILGISVKTVDNHMNKAVRFLYQELKEHLFSALF